MTHKTFCTTLCRAVVAVAFSALATTAQAVFVSGNFDPNDFSGTHTFEVDGSTCFATDGRKSVNNSEANDCRVALTRLTVTLDRLYPLDTSHVHFPDYNDITGINVLGGHLVGVDSALIGPLIAPESSPYTSNDWWIQYASSPLYCELCFDTLAFGPLAAGDGGPRVYLYDCATGGSGCLTNTAYTVTFFPSDANGNPLINGIPEPGSLLLIAAALGAGWIGRRRTPRMGSNG